MHANGPFLEPTKADPPPIKAKLDKKGVLNLGMGTQGEVDARVHRTTGLRCSDAGLRMLAQAAEVTAKTTEDSVPKFNSACARMHDLAPKDALEGMVDALLIAVQDGAFVALKDASMADQYDHRASSGARAERLLRAFVNLAELRTRLRGGGTTQRVTVEHVTVAAGGQAVIGAMASGGGDGGGAGGGTSHSSDGPHAKA